MSASREKRLRRELREAEANSDVVKKVKKEKKPMTAHQSQKIRNIVGTTLGILVVVAFALLIFVNSGFLQKHATAAKVGDHKITPVEFNYFYQDSFYSIYSNMSYYWSYMVDTTKPIEDQECTLSEDGQTWKEYLTDSAVSTATQIYALYDAAQEAGYTLDEETQSSIDAMADTLNAYAESGGYYDADEYLAENYGKGSTVESYIDYMTVQQIASGYATEKSESFEYSDSDLRTFYNENKQEYDTVTYRVFNVATVDDDSSAAKDAADSMQAELDGTEKSFIDAAYSYADEDYKESYEDDSYTLRSNYNYSSISTDYADWLFSEERVGGESEVFVTSSGYSVVMFVSRENNDYRMVDVRHILVSVDATGDDGESTDADWEACRAAMDEIVAEWEASDMTEETFATMADEYSDDTGSVGNGGLYEDVYKGQMVAQFEDWCFEDHTAGDYGVVETDYGCHLIYFVGYGDEYWKTLADEGKRSEDYQTWYDEFTADYQSGTKAFGQMFTTKELPETA